MTGFEIKDPEKGKEGGGSFIKGPYGLQPSWALHQNVDRRHRFRPAQPPPPSLPLLLPHPSPSPGVVGAARLPAIQHGVERDGALAGPPLGNNSDDALFTHNWNRSRR